LETQEEIESKILDSHLLLIIIETTTLVLRQVDQLLEEVEIAVQILAAMLAEVLDQEAVLEMEIMEAKQVGFNYLEIEIRMNNV
jgi:hypothetical protein